MSSFWSMAAAIWTWRPSENEPCRPAPSHQKPLVTRSLHRRVVPFFNFNFSFFLSFPRVLQGPPRVFLPPGGCTRKANCRVCARIDRDKTERQEEKKREMHSYLCGTVSGLERYWIVYTAGCIFDWRCLVIAVLSHQLDDCC